MATSLHLHLADDAGDVVHALRKAFSDHPEVEVLECDILGVAKDTLVSPANSYGHMDGGIDLAYMEHFGWDLQRVVLEEIDRVSGGFVRVGSAVVVETGLPIVHRLIVAPTMEQPGPVGPANAFFAMSALLRVAGEHPEVEHVYTPGLATGVGRVEPEDAAREMEAAYSKWKARVLANPGSPGEGR